MKGQRNARSFTSFYSVRKRNVLVVYLRGLLVNFVEFPGRSSNPYPSPGIVALFPSMKNRRKTDLWRSNAYAASGRDWLFRFTSRPNGALCYLFAVRRIEIAICKWVYGHVLSVEKWGDFDRKYDRRRVVYRLLNYWKWENKEKNTMEIEYTHGIAFSAEGDSILENRNICISETNCLKRLNPCAANVEQISCVFVTTMYSLLYLYITYFYVIV